MKKGKTQRRFVMNEIFEKTIENNKTLKAIVVVHILLAFLSGLVIGMLISPNRDISIASHNKITKKSYRGEEEDEDE